MGEKEVLKFIAALAIDEKIKKEFLTGNTEAAVRRAQNAHPELMELEEDDLLTLVIASLAAEEADDWTEKMFLVVQAINMRYGRSDGWEL